MCSNAAVYESIGIHVTASFVRKFLDFDHLLCYFMFDNDVL